MLLRSLPWFYQIFFCFLVSKASSQSVLCFPLSLGTSFHSDNKQICVTAHLTKLKISITDIWTKSHSGNLLLFSLNKFITAICVLDGNENLGYWTALSCHLDGFCVCTFVFFSVQRLIVPVSLADNSVYEREGQRSGMWVFQVHILSQYTFLFPSSSCLFFFSFNCRSFFKWHQRLSRLLTQWSAATLKALKTLIILLQWHLSGGREAYIRQQVNSQLLNLMYWKQE